VTGEPIHTLEGHTDFVTHVAISPDGKLLASSSYDQTVKIWDLASGEPLRTLKGHSFFVEKLAFSPDGERLASVGRDGCVKIWDPTTDEEALLTLRFRTEENPGVAFSPDGTQLVLATGEGTIKVFDARPLTPEAPVEREALGLLEYLMSKPLCNADVIDHLRTSPTITLAARQLALHLAERYYEETDPERYFQASWALLRQPYLNRFQYCYALLQAQTACDLAPENGVYLTALGVAQYRAGQYREALATLTQADLLHKTVAASLAALALPLPPALVTVTQGQFLAEVISTNLAFLAMTRHQFGRSEEARTTLARLREVMRGPAGGTNREAAGFLREAENLLAGR
jgi:hypothetical protein